MTPRQTERRGRPRKLHPTKTLPRQGPLRAVGYVRVSTADQAEEGTSLRVQEDALRAYAKAQDWELLTIYTDAGLSGATLDRAELRRLLEDLAPLGVHRVIVTRLDRLARSTRNLLELYDRLEQLGVGIVAIRDSVDTTTPVGRLMRTVLAAVAELERETIAERVQSGRLARARQGAYLGGAVPYGYRLAPDGAWHVDEDEAGAVRRIFRMRARGATLQAIAATLEGTGLPTPRGGQHWHPSTVQRISENPIYWGKATWGKRPRKGAARPVVAEVGSVPALVSARYRQSA